jgi:hypothetical protein
MVATLSLGTDLGLGLPMEHVIRQCLIALRLSERRWQATDAMAEALGLGDDVRTTLEQSFERWDGKNTPRGLKGEQIELTSRLVSLADVVEVFHRADGVEAAVEVARSRAGTQFDPKLVEVFCEEAPLLFSDLDAATSWDAVPGRRTRARSGDRRGAVRRRPRGRRRLHRPQVRWDGHPKTFWRRVLFSRIRGHQLDKEVPASLQAAAELVTAAK